MASRASYLEPKMVILAHITMAILVLEVDPKQTLEILVSTRRLSAICKRFRKRALKWLVNAITASW